VSFPRIFRRQALSRAGLLLGLLFCTACGLFDDAATVRSAEPDASASVLWPTQVAEPPLPVVQAKPAAPPRIENRAVRAMTPSSNRPSGQLLGSERSEVLASLGKPDSRVEIGLAQRWQYAGRDCVVDLLFFYDTNSQRFRLALMRSEYRDVDAADAARCLVAPLPTMWLS
jgi:hypothetical protein